MEVEHPLRYGLIRDGDDSVVAPCEESMTMLYALLVSYQPGMRRSYRISGLEAPDLQVFIMERLCQGLEQNGSRNCLFWPRTRRSTSPIFLA